MGSTRRVPAGRGWPPSTAEAIQRLRAFVPLTQRELAEILGVSVPTISRYENGRKPAARIVRALAGVSESVRYGVGVQVFGGMWRGSVVSQVGSLPSRGSARRVPVSILEAWAEDLKRADLTKVLKEIELFIEVRGAAE